MGTQLLIVSNIVIPIITGLFFFVYFVYFIIAFNSKASSFIYFVIFLLSFSLFLLGRPLQLLLGGHPAQLIIVNIRMLLFCTLTITSIIVASTIFSNRFSRRRMGWVFGIGIALAAVYIVFNTLGTVGSYPVFTLGDLVAYDALTPELAPPFYGREVTIAVQVLIGFALFLHSAYRIVKSMRDTSAGNLSRRKILLFNSGILLFALTFIIGSFAKQWWIYYFASMFSAMLFAGGVIIDIRELYNNFERLTPFIREDIIQNVVVSSTSRKKLTGLLTGLDKTERLDSFSVIVLKNPEFEAGYELGALEAVMSTCRRVLDRLIGRRNYLLIPLDGRKIGVALGLGELEETGQPPSELEIFEELQGAMQRRSQVRTVIGIGRRCADISGLHSSYQEARHAIEYANDMPDSGIIHANDIGDEYSSGPRYPTNEKLRLLSAVKHGNPTDCQTALSEFLEAFRPFIATGSLKVRLYELVGALFDTAVAVGANAEKLGPLVDGWLAETDRMTSFEKLSEWLSGIVETVVSFMSRTRKTRSSVIIKKAIETMETKFAQPIGYKDVAKEVFLSSSYFLTLFKQETGSTFVEFLTRVRIDRAKELLLETEKSITDISYDVGFSNPNYFSTTFSKLTGVTAKHFRDGGGRIAEKPKDSVGPA